MKSTAPILFISALLLGLLIPVGASASDAGSVRRSARLAALEADVLTLLNETRDAHGIAPLRVSPGLSTASRQHSQEMARLGYFSHDSANGGSFDVRVARWYPFSATFRRWAVGENLIFGARSLDASKALRLWMCSPEHRRNILDPTWTEIGISAVQASAARGIYGGAGDTIITTDFGARS